MYMVMFVLDEPCELDGVLAAWETIGVSGVTIIESTGIQRRKVQRRLIPARFSLGQAPTCEEENHYTLFAIVPDEARARQCLAAAEAVVGNLDEPHTGVLAAWPLTLVKGIPDRAEAAR